MKRFLFFLLALVAYGNSVWAQIQVDDALAIDDVEIAPGGEATVTVQLKNLGSGDFLGFEIDIILPEGITPKLNKQGKISTKLSDNQKDPDDEDRTFTVSSNPSVGGEVTHIRFILTSPNAYELVQGDIFSFTLQASNDYVVTPYEAPVSGEESQTSDIKISSRDDVRFKTNPFSFFINPMTLDENKEGGYEAFAAYTGKVIVKRTISANNWNTICLPLSMTVAQVKTAFGDDVQLATFSGCTPSKNKNNDVTGLNLHFASVSLNGADNTEVFQANTPYLIKVETAVTEPFTLDPATITEITDGTPTTTGTGGSFIGTYKYISALGSETHPYMFLSGNTFYTAIGSTKMKPFRAYFDLDDLAAYRAYRNSHSSANVNIFVDDEQVTGIDGVTIGQGNVDAVYDLQGRLVKVDGDLNNLEKGIYIINGQKVTVK